MKASVRERREMSCENKVKSEKLKEAKPGRRDFDFTMMSIFSTCQRKYYYRIEQGLVGHRPP